MNNIATITWLTFHEARRRKMVLAALLLGLVFLLLYLAGFVFIASQVYKGPGLSSAASALQSADALLGITFLTIMGFYAVHFLTVMLAIFASVDSISGEITSHTIQAIATKPVRRWEIVLGKWLGYAIMIVPYTALLSGGIVLIVYAITGFVAPNVLPVVGLMGLQALVLVSLSLLGGTRFSTLTNGVVLFMLFGLAFIGSWIEQVGALFQSREAVDIGIITSLVMPVEALWRYAAGLMETGVLPIAQLSVLFGAGSTPSPLMVVYSVAFALVMLAFAMRQFSKRDL